MFVWLKFELYFKWHIIFSEDRDGRHWTDSTDWWRTLNWQYSTAQYTHWTVQFWFSLHTLLFLISYLYRIPFRFIFPLPVVWCCFINFLSQFVVTRVLLCVVFNLCTCTVRHWASGLPFAAYKSGEEWNTVCGICVGLADWASDAGYWIFYMLVAVMCVYSH